MSAAAALVAVALVADDATVLRNRPDDAGAAQATLWRGDWLEVRGQTEGFLRVYDHRRERPGFVRPASVRVHRVDAAAAPELRAIVLFLRDAAGHESLGIGYAALWLKATPAGALGTAEGMDVLHALGVMAERLALRASRRGGDAAVAGHLAVAAGYGVRLESRERGSLTLVCYDGEALVRVLASAVARAEARVEAALALTGRRCADPDAAPAQRRAALEGRLALLERVDPADARNTVPPHLGHRVRLRLAAVAAERAFELMRAGDAEGARRAEERALRALAGVDAGELAPEDRAVHREAVVRVAAGRWMVAGPPPRRPTGAPEVTLEAGAPGETCLVVAEGRRTLARRCTFGIVWPGSLRWAPRGRGLTVTVQPLAAWSEVWVLVPGERAEDGWRALTVVPAVASPDADVGYAEAGGFSPDGTRLLVAREARVGTRFVRRFEVLALPSGRVELGTGDPSRLTAIRRWAAASWRAETLALR